MTLTDKLEALLAGTGVPWTANRDGFETSQKKNPAYGENEWRCPDEMHAEYIDTIRAERDLIVAAVNALPALLRVVRAAEAWRESKTDDGEELRAALDALDKETP